MTDKELLDRLRTMHLYTRADLDAAVQAERERCAAICERIEEKQDRDNGAANTGGAAECAAAIRGQS